MEQIIINQVTTVQPIGQTGLILIDNPPVNVLAAIVRQGIAAALEHCRANDRIKAVVILCQGKCFFAGADITEFGGPIADPDLSALIQLLESYPKPIVAAMHGTALGGGFEFALACHARIATSSARMGLPEVKLGLIPGCGGSRRLTRLAGADIALNLITSGEMIDAAAAQKCGILDQVVASDRSETGAPQTDILQTGALALAERLIAEGKPPRRTLSLTQKLSEAQADPEKFTRFRLKNQSRFRQQQAPERAILCIEAAVNKPDIEAAVFESATFDYLERHPQSAALRHVFFAEREARKIPDISKDQPLLPIQRVGIVGAGTMGGGIAMCFANAGFEVMLIDRQQAALERGLATIVKNYQRSLSHGRISQQQFEQRMARINHGVEYQALAECDLIIEAVFEDIEVKKEVFTQLDLVARPDAILATNTSFLDINAIASVTRRPENVIGLHFFSPANVMRLLEVVRAGATSDMVIATAMNLAGRLGKIGVLVSVCHGFVGNRMLAKRQAAAGKLLLQGVMPWDVDRVLYDFGMPMGPFAMHDLAGLDLGWTKERSTGATIEELLCEAGRFGQKNRMGFYDYDDNGKATPAKITEDLLLQLVEKSETERQTLSDAEILQRCLQPMIEEGTKLLEEGIALRSSDIDVVWIAGYGWPAWTGGPLYWAEQQGILK